MNWRYPDPGYFITLLLLCTATGAFSQPLLPDMSCSVFNNSVLLSWNCQYDGVKNISVFRSADSSMNYSLVGFVKTLKKGVQTFEDEHPYGGKNYYRLTITFKSGLNWNSNYCKAVVLQGATTSVAPKPAPQPAVRVDTAGRRAQAPMTQPARPAMTETGALATVEKKRVVCDTVGKGNNNISLTFIPDSVTGRLQLPRRRPVISTDDPSLRQPDLIKSQYIFADQVTGHIKMELPEDIGTAHYSVRFYDGQNNAVVDVQRVNNTKLLLDRRNFRRRGMYKFILRKDGLELERGYVNVN
jgi:hypothetical protein